jgi:hypothetical protein
MHMKNIGESKRKEIGATKQRWLRAALRSEGRWRDEVSGMQLLVREAEGAQLQAHKSAVQQATVHAHAARHREGEVKQSETRFDVCGIHSR